MFTKKSALGCFVALTFSLTLYAADSTSTRGPQPLSGSGAKKGSWLDSKWWAPKGWKDNLSAILEETDKWYGGHAFDIMEKFKKAGSRKDLADLIEGGYLEKFGDSLLSGKNSEAFDHLFDFIQYGKRIDRRVAVHIDRALADQLDWCVTKASDAEKKPCIQVLLNPGIVTAELLNWDSFFQMEVEQHRASVLDAALAYPDGMGLFCQNYFNDTVEHYGTAKKTYKQTAQTTAGSSGSRGGSKNRPVTLRAMTAVTLSLAYPQRLGQMNCPCSQMAATGFVCGACGLDPLAMEDSLPGLLGAGDRLPSSSPGGGGSATTSGGGPGGGGRSGFFGTSDENPLGGLTGEQANLGCGMNFGGGAGGGASGFAPCRAGTSQFADSVRSQSPGGTLTSCVQQYRTDMMNAGPSNLGVLDAGCNLAADGQQQGEGQRANLPSGVQRAIDRIQNNPAGQTPAVQRAIDRIQSGQVPVETRPEGTGAEGVSGPTRLSMTSDCQNYTPCAVHEIGHVAGMNEREARNFARQVTGGTGDIPPGYRGRGGMPDPFGGGGDSCSAAARMVSDFLNCTGITDMSAGAEQAWENSPQGGSPNPWINPAPDSAGTGGGMGMPPMPDCGGGPMSDAEPWWLAIVDQYGVTPRGAGAVDPCQPGDDACGSTGDGGGPIQDRRGWVIDPAGEGGTPFGAGPTAAPSCSSCAPGSAGAACRAVCQDAPTGGGGGGPDPEGGGD